jgi:hypothetical protein
MNDLIQKISQTTASITIGLLLMLATILAYQGVANGQKLENAAECGADIKLNVSDSCTSEKQIENCINSRPAGMTDADKQKACNPQRGIESLITTILNVFSAIVGSIAVIMIIIGGFKYVTSAGDSNSATSARNTILFAIVGLIIVVFAQIIVRFVLQRI